MLYTCANKQILKGIVPRESFWIWFPFHQTVSAKSLMPRFADFRTFRKEKFRVNRILFAYRQSKRHRRNSNLQGSKCLFVVKKWHSLFMTFFLHISWTVQCTYCHNMVASGCQWPQRCQTTLPTSLSPVSMTLASSLSSILSVIFTIWISWKSKTKDSGKTSVLGTKTFSRKSASYRLNVTHCHWDPKGHWNF